MFELFEKYMISPFYEQESLPGYNNTAAMFLFGTYLIIVIIYTASLFLEKMKNSNYFLQLWDFVQKEFQISSVKNYLATKIHNTIDTKVTMIFRTYGK